MELVSCISCGMETPKGIRYPNLCRMCERSMSEEEIIAMMDSI